MSEFLEPRVKIDGVVYVWERDFFKLPAEVKIEKNTHQVQVDKQGRIYVHSPSDHAVIVFDKSGQYVSSWGSHMHQGAHGMQIREEDGTEYLYFATTNQHWVSKNTLDGREIFRLGAPAESGKYREEGQYNPTNIAFAPNGDFYVGDGYGMHYIHQYTKDGKFIRTWGGYGSDPGLMNCPHGLAVDTRGKEPLLVVADRGNHRLQRFTLDGKHVDFITHDLRLPCHFDFHGGLTLIPDLQGRVTLMDENYKLVAQLGDNPKEGERANNGVKRGDFLDGRFIAPHGGCFDKDGNIFIAEWVNDGGRLTRLRRE
ncbi:MAG: hypothetical protein HZC36_16910 [Armatimonadetes bacterium]|nr:hypothetical protein [Armatimonadota bacterium]